MSEFTVAAAQYPIEALANWTAYAQKLTRWVGEAAAAGARLAVFPEYGAMELAALDPATMSDLAASLAAVSALLPRIDALHAELARRHGLHILAASAPRRDGDGRARNAARLFAPSGAMATQDKLVMTRFEAEEWQIAPGERLRLFETALGRIGVCICYDSEFPLIARALVEAGAELLLVPSCTDTRHGLARVRIGAQARALEGQCFVVHSATVGAAAWSPAVDGNRGQAAVYAPPDASAAGAGLPADGVIAEGVLDAAQWVFARVDPVRVAALRAVGAVRNVRDWAHQPGAAPLPAVEVVALR